MSSIPPRSRTAEAAARVVVAPLEDTSTFADRAYAAFDQEAKRREITYEQIVKAEPVITSDGDRVLQIISNLLSNAFRWTPDGGRLAVELGAENGSVSIAVQDNGPGIAPERRPKVFDPFYTTKAKGTGLGMAIAKRIVEAHGGQIAVGESDNPGAGFLITLPKGPS